MIANIFLDFFNRDSRQIFGLFANTPREQHIRLLTEATNIAAFLCSEYCILPPGFLAECEIARAAVLCRPNYVIERLIRLPLRENTLDEFWDKKRREYSSFRTKYRGLFNYENEVLLRRFSESIITRNAKIADEILRTWEDGPDTEGAWRGVISRFSAREIEVIRAVPRRIRNEGEAVTWPAIFDRIKVLNNTNSSSLRHVLQNQYFNIYMREYGLTVVTQLPFARFSFVLGSNDLTNDYEALRAALATLGLWDLIANLSADSMLSLRYRDGYYRFRRLFDRVTQKAASVRTVGACFARAAADSPTSRGLRKMLATYTGTLPSQHGYEPTEGDIHAIAERLGKVESAELEMARVNEQEAIKPRSVSPSKRPVIAIYVALKMERLFLVKRWNLTGEYPDPVRRGRLGEVDVLLYGQDEMGRVSAAVATMQFLEKYPKPDMLLVTGIAGGFDREGSSRGDVLIPTSIADLASRKIHGGGHVIPEFRPREFRTDARLSRYVNSGSFKTRDWEGAVIEEAEWPEGLRPSIRNGPIASLDEVVSDTQWIDTLCKAWPKLCGVDMESGGVCAAAEAHELKVAVVRGVSDLADPAIVGRCLEAKSHENRRPPA